MDMNTTRTETEATYGELSDDQYLAHQHAVRHVCLDRTGDDAWMQVSANRIPLPDGVIVEPEAVASWILDDQGFSPENLGLDVTGLYQLPCPECSTVLSDGRLPGPYTEIVSGAVHTDERCDLARSAYERMMAICEELLDTQLRK